MPARSAMSSIDVEVTPVANSAVAAVLVGDQAPVYHLAGGRRRGPVTVSGFSALDAQCRVQLGEIDHIRLRDAIDVPASDTTKIPIKTARARSRNRFSMPG